MSSPARSIPWLAATRANTLRSFMTVFPVTTPPGVEALFQALSNFKGFETTPEPSLGMAAWVVPDGFELDNGSFAIIVFASTDHLFSFRLETDGTGAIDPLPFSP